MFITTKKEESKVTQINIIGTILGITGYDIHTRQLANALNKLVPTRLSVPLVPNWETMVNDDELKMLKREPKNDEINLIITMPHTWKLNTKNGRNWAYVIWEGDKVPTGWIEEFTNPDIEYIFVPSGHTRTAVQNTIKELSSITQIIITDKIKIIPHGVDHKLFYPMDKPNKTVFLANKGFRNMEDRGGIQYLIRAYLDEFKQEDVELIIKINPAYGIPTDAEIKTIFKIDNNSPKISIITDALPYEKMNEIYNKANVFVSPTRAEAFNIPCIEAMSCGLPVITSNFGGQTDYCNEENGWIISGEMTDVNWDLQYEGVKWLTPDIQQLRNALREATDGVQRKEKAEKSLETAKGYSWDLSAEKLMELI